MPDLRSRAQLQMMSAVDEEVYEALWQGDSATHALRSAEMSSGETHVKGWQTGIDSWAFWKVK